jgi:glycosyltransferase involved in cell wall biosynthesis
VKTVDEPLVSVIIPTYNSKKTLSKCLSSLKNQSYKNIEIIVVDNFSKDETVEIAKNYGAKVFQVNAERAMAKNFGLKKAEGKYVCFIDSDMELTKDVIKESVELIERSERVGGVVIPERSVGTSFWVVVRNFERSFYTSTYVESARFFRKDLAEKVGGFDESVILFEESTLPQKIKKLGYNVEVRINAEILHHEEDFSLLMWLKKKFYYGKTITKYRREHGDYASKQLNIFYRLFLFLKNRRFYSKPTLAIGVLILKFLEYCSIELGSLTSRLRRS